MSFTAYLPSGFEHPHENVMFENLVQSLRSRFEAATEPHYLIGNVMLDGQEIDALLLKPNAACVIEMKNYGGMIHFSENGDWFADEIVVRGGGHLNPFRQVRAYKFAVLNYLHNREIRFLERQREIGWGQISGMVLFGKPIQFDEQLPVNVRPWFRVVGMNQIADEIASLNSPQIKFTNRELVSLIRLVGVQDNHAYVGTVASGKPLVPQDATKTVSLKHAYHTESKFQECELRMRNAGTARSQGAIRVQQMFGDMRRGLNPFNNLTLRNDSRIEGVVVYRINDFCEMAVIKAGQTIYPFFLGEPAEVEQWLEANRGLTLAVDGVSQRITPTFVTSEASSEHLTAPSLTTDNVPFFSRVKTVDLETLIPQRLIRRALAELDEESTDEEIVEVLQDVLDEDLRKFLFNLISLIRSNDIAAAEARIRLRNGEAIPATEAGTFGEEAVGSPANSDQIIDVTKLSEHEFALYNDPKRFQEWMLLLHEDQKNVVEQDFTKPVVLTGVSGSGKTCILVHRARYLARKYPGQKIGVMTLNRELAKLLDHLVKQLCTEEERRSIHVMAFYDYFKDLIHRLGPDRFLENLQALAPDSRRLKEAIALVDRKNFANEIDLKSNETAENTWDEFYGSRDHDVQEGLKELESHLVSYRLDASKYLRDECTLVRSGLALSERNNYLSAEDFPRIGRGSTPQFLGKHRVSLLSALLLFEEWMIHGAVLDIVELTLALTPLWREIRELPTEQKFRCLLVDEFQDLSNLDLRLLAHVPTNPENGLFLAGDSVQRILVKRLKLSEAGLAKGNFVSKEIKKNYRNSRQILKAASLLANHYGQMAKSQGEEIDVLDPELAQRETNPPIALQTDNQIRKAWELALECLESDKTAPWTVCIATAAPEKFSVRAILDQQPASIEADELSGDCILRPDRMVVGTIHDLKGFEFRLVVIIGCDKEIFPADDVPHDEVWRDALRLYVAMTRGRDQVYLLHDREPSEFVEVMGETLVRRQEPVLRQYKLRRTEEGRTAQPIVSPAKVVAARKTPIEWDENCESWFKESELNLLKRYFARHVYRNNLTFHEWCCPKALNSLRPELFFRLRNCGRRDIQHLLDKLRANGLRLAPSARR